jgi:hypothetical protein
VTIEEECDTPLVDNAAVDLSEVELAKNVEEFSLKKSINKSLPSQRYETKAEENSVI